MKKLLIFSILFLSINFIFAQGAWKLVGYKFTDGTSSSEKPLAGTSDIMIDAIKFTGEKGNIQITKNRNDKSTGKLLAGVTYNVTWSEPSSVLVVGEKIKMNYSLKTITSSSWTPEPQSVKFNQGISGLFLFNPSNENYFKKDFNAEIISQGALEKGYKDREIKVLTVNMGCGFKAEYSYEWHPEYQSGGSDASAANTNTNSNSPGWYFVKYEFVDGTSSSEKPLAGTNDYMIDASKFTGGKGNIQITKNRTDKSSGNLLAGVTYSVIWTDPQAFVAAGGTFKMSYTLKTISSKSWTPEAQSASFNQGLYGNFLLNPSGENYFKKDFSGDIVSQKVLEKGAKDKEQKTLTINLGSGFKAVYYYKWRN